MRKLLYICNIFSMHQYKVKFFNPDEILNFQNIFNNKYVLRKILKEYVPIILISYFYNNIYWFIFSCILQLLICKNIYNFIVCILFLGFFLYKQKFKDKFILNILYIYTLINYIIEYISIINNINKNTKLVYLIGIISNIILFIHLNANEFNIYKILIMNGFIIFSIFITPVSFETRKEKILDNNQGIDHQSSYKYILSL